MSSTGGSRVVYGGSGAITSMIFCRSLYAWIGQVFSCMGSCLGCYTRPTLITAVDEPSKGLRIQGQCIRKPSISDDFWSTSTYEMENSGVHSQRSISSINASTQARDPHGGGSSTNPPEFVNHGLILWNQTRQQWIGSKKPDKRTEQVIDPRLSWNANSLLGTNKPFPHTISFTDVLFVTISNTIKSNP